MTELDRRLAGIEYDLAALVRLQGELLTAVHSIVDLLDERLAYPEEEPTAEELWLLTQNPDDHGDDISWKFRALGRYYGYPDCCIEAFIVNRVMPYLDQQHALYPLAGLHPDRGYVMCDDCAADPERADRLAAEALARRVAPEEAPVR